MRSTPEDLRARFYEDYRKVAEDYDREFIKKCDEDLSTTLIFASVASYSGAYALTQITDWSFLCRHFRLQHPGPTGAPARSERRNSRPPSRPNIQNGQHHFRWRRSYSPTVVRSPALDCPGPSYVVRQFHCFSLVRILGDARQAMVESNASTDMRGTAIERSRNRQRKLNGIVAWYFEHVIPLMLRASLLLLGCALCQYLWEIDVTIASVVLGVTSFGVAFYFFVVAAGAVSENCPYQTPGSRILRSVSSAVPPTFRRAIELSVIVRFFRNNVTCCRPSQPI